MSGAERDDDRWSDAVTPLVVVAERLAAFNAERDWGQFHNPKDLAICLAGEAAEVLELFLWKSSGPPEDLEPLRQELADVVISTVNLAQRVGIDLTAAVQDKIALNAQRYPAALSRGNATKYNQLKSPTDD